MLDQGVTDLFATPTNAFPGPASGLLGADPFLSFKPDDDDGMLFVRDWPQSQPISPTRMDDERPVEPVRSQTPSGRSPRMSRPKNPPNLYNALMASPIMQSPGLMGFSPPMPMFAASPLMPALPAADGTWQSPPTNAMNMMELQASNGQEYDWMRPKRRRGTGNSPLLTSTTVGSLGAQQQQQLVTDQNGMSYYLPTPHPNTLSFPQIYHMMAMSQYPQKAPKLAMSPSKRTAKDELAKPPMVLPFRMSQAQEEKPSASESLPAVSGKVVTEDVPADNRIMTEMEQNCNFFITEARKLCLDDMERITVVQLKGLLKKVNQNATGKKDELVERVKQFKQTCEDFLKSMSTKTKDNADEEGNAEEKAEEPSEE